MFANGFAWARGLFAIALLAEIVGIVIGSPTGGFVIIFGALVLIGTGFLLITDVGGAGTRWVQDYLRWLPTWLPRNRSLYSTTNLYRLAGVMVWGFAFVTLFIGAFLAQRPR